MTIRRQPRLPARVEEDRQRGEGTRKKGSRRWGLRADRRPCICVDRCGSASACLREVQPLEATRRIRPKSRKGRSGTPTRTAMSPIAGGHRHVDCRGEGFAPVLPWPVPHRRGDGLPRIMAVQSLRKPDHSRRCRCGGYGVFLSPDRPSQPSPLPLPPWVHPFPERASGTEHSTDGVSGGCSPIGGGEGVDVTSSGGRGPGHSLLGCGRGWKVRHPDQVVVSGALSSGRRPVARTSPVRSGGPMGGPSPTPRGSDRPQGANGSTAARSTRVPLPRGVVRGYLFDAPRRRGRTQASRTGRSALCCGGGRTRTRPLGGLSPTPVHPYRRRPALLPEWGDAGRIDTNGSETGTTGIAPNTVVRTSPMACRCAWI